MPSANEQLTQAICDALVAEGLVSGTAAAGLAKSISNGKIKAEDWYSAIDEASQATPGEECDGRQDAT